MGIHIIRYKKDNIRLPGSVFGIASGKQENTTKKDQDQKEATGNFTRECKNHIRVIL